MRKQIIDRFLHSLDGIAECAERCIAAIAQPSSKVSSFVVMVQTQAAYVPTKIATTVCRLWFYGAQDDRMISFSLRIATRNTYEIRKCGSIFLVSLRRFWRRGIVFFRRYAIGADPIGLHIGLVLFAMTQTIFLHVCAICRLSAIADAALPSAFFRTRQGGVTAAIGTALNRVFEWHMSLYPSRVQTSNCVG